MKIALIDPIGAKMGMNHYDDGLMHALSGKGFTSFILSNYKSSFENIQSKIFFDNINKSKLSAAWNNFSGMIRSINFCRMQQMNYILYHIFRGGFFDLFALIIAKLCGLKILLIVHDIETIDTTPNKFIKRIVLQHFHAALVVHNRYTMEKLKEFTRKPSVTNIHVIPHGNYMHTAKNFGTRSEALQYFNLEPSQRYLLFFGQVKKTKGLDILLEALHVFKSSYKLIIAGKLRVESFDPYQKIIDQHNLHDRVISMLRYITEEEKNKLFSLCDAVVLPYKAIYQSGVLLMAMSFGKPVIASDLPPFKEIIQHGINGLLFEKNNPHALASVIDELFAGKFRIEEISENAKQHVDKNFSWSEIANQYAGLLSSI